MRRRGARPVREAGRGNGPVERPAPRHGPATGPGTSGGEVEMDAGPEREAAARLAQHLAVAVQVAEAVIRLQAQRAETRAAGHAQAAAAGRADTDPTADVAARRVEARLAEMAPTAMTRFDQLRVGGLDRTAAMRDVLGHLAAESSYRPRVFVAEPGPAAAAAAAVSVRVRASAAAATDRQVRYIVDLLD